MVDGAINGERLTILHPGDSGGWRPSGHTGQSTILLLVDQVSDGGRNCGRYKRENDITIIIIIRLYVSLLLRGLKTYMKLATHSCLGDYILPVNPLG